MSRTGMMILTGYSMYESRTWVLILTCVFVIVAPCNASRVCALACLVDLDGREYN